MPDAADVVDAVSRVMMGATTYFMDAGRCVRGALMGDTASQLKVMKGAALVVGAVGVLIGMSATRKFARS